MDKTTIAGDLNDLLATEARSLARHAQEARPYLSPQDHCIWAQVQEASRLSHDHERKLTGLIMDMGLSPRPGAFRTELANYHFLDLPTLRLRLIQEKERQVERYRRAIEHAHDHPRLTQQLQTLLNQILDQLQQLEAGVNSGT